MKTGRKKRGKFTNGARITLATASILSFIGGWNLIARMDNKKAQADEPPAAPPPTSGLPNVLANPTPWPTVPPLADIPPVPTLIPTLSTFGQLQPAEPGQTPLQMAPLPALMPLPTMAPLPEIPAPPPPPPVHTGGGGNRSGGS